MALHELNNNQQQELERIISGIQAKNWRNILSLLKSEISVSVEKIQWDNSTKTGNLENTVERLNEKLSSDRYKIELDGEILTLVTLENRNVEISRERTDPDQKIQDIEVQTKMQILQSLIQGSGNRLLSSQIDFKNTSIDGRAYKASVFIEKVSGIISEILSKQPKKWVSKSKNKSGKYSKPQMLLEYMQKKQWILITRQDIIDLLSIRSWSIDYMVRECKKLIDTEAPLQIWKIRGKWFIFWSKAHQEIIKSTYTTIPHKQKSKDIPQKKVTKSIPKSKNAYPKTIQKLYPLLRSRKGEVISKEEIITCLKIAENSWWYFLNIMRDIIEKENSNISDYTKHFEFAAIRWKWYVYRIKGKTQKNSTGGAPERIQTPNETKKKDGFFERFMANRWRIISVDAIKAQYKNMSPSAIRVSINDLQPRIDQYNIEHSLTGTAAIRIHQLPRENRWVMGNYEEINNAKTWLTFVVPIEKPQPQDHTALPSEQPTNTPLPKVSTEKQVPNISLKVEGMDVSSINKKREVFNIKNSTFLGLEVSTNELYFIYIVGMNSKNPLRITDFRKYCTIENVSNTDLVIFINGLIEGLNKKFNEVHFSINDGWHCVMTITRNEQKEIEAKAQRLLDILKAHQWSIVTQSFLCQELCIWPEEFGRIYTHLKNILTDKDLKISRMQRSGEYVYGSMAERLAAQHNPSVPRKKGSWGNTRTTTKEPSPKIEEKDFWPDISEMRLLIQNQSKDKGIMAEFRENDSQFLFDGGEITISFSVEEYTVFLYFLTNKWNFENTGKSIQTFIWPETRVTPELISYLSKLYKSINRKLKNQWHDNFSITKKWSTYGISEIQEEITEREYRIWNQTIVLDQESGDIVVNGNTLEKPSKNTFNLIQRMLKAYNLGDKRRNFWKLVKPGKNPEAAFRPIIDYIQKNQLPFWLTSNGIMTIELP